MSDVKITVRNDGSLLVSGPVTLEDAAGQPFGLSGRTVDRALPLRPLGEQAVLRRLAQPRRLQVRSRGARAAAAEAEALSVQARRIPSEVQMRNALRTAAGESGLPALRAARRSAFPSGAPAARAVSRWNSPRARSSR